MPSRPDAGIAVPAPDAPVRRRGPPGRAGHTFPSARPGATRQDTTRPGASRQGLFRRDPFRAAVTSRLRRVRPAIRPVIRLTVRAADRTTVRTATCPPPVAGIACAVLMRPRTAMALGLVMALPLASPIPVTPARADVNTELNRFWNDLGATSTFTGPTSFQGQAAGYYTGGSLRTRTGVRNAQIAAFSLPSVEAGCGGIDIFSGSLSIISKNELVQLSKAIAANAVGYAFDLALETLAPVMAETMKDLRRKLQAINQANINSCEAAEALVMGVWPKSQRASQAVCARLGAGRGGFIDYAASKHGCGTAGGYAGIRSGASAEEKTQWPDNINIAWEVLRGDHLGAGNWLASDRQMAEIMMTMTGTVIIRGGEVKPFPGFGRDDAFIDWIINGGDSSFNMYGCPDDACLNMTYSTGKRVNTASSLKGRVERGVNGLITAIRTDTRPTAAQQALVNRTSLPLYRILNVHAAWSGPIITTQRRQLIEAVTLDLALIHIRGMVEEIRIRAEAAPMAGQEAMELWRERLDALSRAVNARQLEGSKGYANALELVDRVRMIEAHLGSRFGAGFGQTTQWNRQMSARR